MRPKQEVRAALRQAAIVCVLVVSLPIACRPSPTASPFTEDTPRLVVLLVVDQMTQEYLQRLRPLLDGGLEFLLDNGVVFSDAHHYHADTVTGAGHATLSSGCYPSRSGIVSNEWYDRATGDRVYCVQGNDYRRSPKNLLVDTIGDRLKQMDPASKVFSAGGKDRSAILLGGHQADGSFWYDGGNGDWVTTGYWEEPEWLAEFNDRKLVDRYFGTLWEPLWVAEDMLEQLGIVQLDEGIYQRRFPYPLGGKSLARTSSFYTAVYESPLGDAYLAELAKTIVEQEDLGGDEHPDYLGIGFHALDYVGHDFGPNSREVVDTILRLDQTLADLLEFFDERIGLDNMVVGLSADHGVMPMPEYRELLSMPGRRTGVDETVCFQTVGRQLEDSYGNHDWLNAGLYLNEEAIAEEGLDRRALETEIAAMLGACPGVAHVWTRSELLSPNIEGPGPDVELPDGTWISGDEADHFRQLFINSYHPDRGADFEILYEPFHLNRRSAGSTHGTPYRHDTWVPMIVLAPGVPARVVGERAHTVDMAPTLAAIMGIEMGDAVDGTDLTPKMLPSAQ